MRWYISQSYLPYEPFCLTRHFPCAKRESQPEPPSFCDAPAKTRQTCLSLYAVALDKGKLPFYGIEGYRFLALPCFSRKKAQVINQFLTTYLGLAFQSIHFFVVSCLPRNCSPCPVDVQPILLLIKRPFPETTDIVSSKIKNLWQCMVRALLIETLS